MSDYYINKEDFNDEVRDAFRESAKENNPGLDIDSETVTCPVPGVDDENVLLFRVLFKEEEPA